jgi:hypothetical protein
MPKVNQLIVRCENRPGTLAHIAKVMGDADVNILGFLLTTSGTKGHVKLIVDNVEKAKEALDDAGFSYVEQVVLHAKLANVVLRQNSICTKNQTLAQPTLDCQPLGLRIFTQ